MISEELIATLISDGFVRVTSSCNRSVASALVVVGDNVVLDTTTEAVLETTIEVVLGVVAVVEAVVTGLVTRLIVLLPDARVMVFVIGLAAFVFVFTIVAGLTVMAEVMVVVVL